MKKQFIAVAVTGFILFFWQFLSFAALEIHKPAMQYTDQQDVILEALKDLPPGQYYLPQAAPGEDPAAFMEKAAGKPWAKISYHASLHTGMALPMLRSFGADLVAAWLLVWLLLQFRELSMIRAVTASLAVGGVAFLTIPYLDSVWFENTSVYHFVDWLVQWSLTGLWLGWWLKR
jgi:hypothetical protein